jgi:nucleoside-diphosphate-sugar epimerase
MKRVLVTGASGFIGSHALRPLIEHGFDVHMVTSKKPGPQQTNCKWHIADLLDSTQVSGLISAVQPTHLLHFAWYLVPKDYLYSMNNFLWVKSSLELLLRFGEYGGQRAVMAGTCFEYDTSYGYCLEFLTPKAATSVYGKCKHAMQIMLEGFSTTTGLSSAWGRIFFLYGPHEHPNRLISSVICSLLKGEPARCSHGNQIRDFLYVEDVAEAFVALLESNVTGPVNVASGCPIALRDIIYKIAEKIDRKDLIQLGVLPVPVHEPHLLVADVSRLTNEVGWLPKYNLDRGLEQTIAWWRDYLVGKEYESAK